MSNYWKLTRMNKAERFWFETDVVADAVADVQVQ